MKKILVLTTVNSTINAFLIPHIQDLKKKEFYVECAANITSDIDDRLIKDNIIVHNLPFSRNPLSLSNIEAFRLLIKLQKENNYDIIFMHTPIASIYGRLLKLKFKSIKIIYMAHGFHFYKGASITNWLVYYPIEKICSYLTDVLITINSEDYELAKKKMKSKKVYYVPGIGFDTNKFSSTKVDKAEKRKELGINEDDIMILSVGELNKNKNHEVIIKAIANIRRDDIHYFIAGEGKLKDYLYSLAQGLGIKNRVHLLGFRKDVNELYKTADIFCFPSLREGLGLSALEAMACGMPILTSDIHGINDYSIEGKTGFKCKATSIDGFKCNIEKILSNSEISNQMAKLNKEKVKKYDLYNVKKYMNEIYKYIG